MRRTDQYPIHCSGGSCFIMHDWDPKEGVIDTGIDVDSLPYGTIAISAKAVRAMADLLGYDINPGKQRRIDRLTEIVAGQRAELIELRAAAGAVLNAAELAGLREALAVETDDSVALVFEEDADEPEVAPDAAEVKAPAKKAAAAKK